ncbi:MAG: hypothetical protein D8M57_15440 [Candidatus Scalindua sp. AMX11]|nr:MAG: hypothetical protein DWQ00_06080 [Candidatus Scalindua sp.]NOG82568.1 hypothetical protein [Planctomycetota bacterium]RZV93997.1 MAG: hypothetical protein EX341_03840 [Candidatus Scalindua sp. SCAELEC01]TDE63960.1 MAG: hypothetical protein D8M57_15440 [Candidatus Scalindua sp. AMX11]GJQ57437.1 MAG: hypothetical protein SCALA701_02380 [Candidatus Scalindua sp.]
MKAENKKDSNRRIQAIATSLQSQFKSGNKFKAILVMIRLLGGLIKRIMSEHRTTEIAVNVFRELTHVFYNRKICLEDPIVKMSINNGDKSLEYYQSEFNKKNSKYYKLSTINTLIFNAALDNEGVLWVISSNKVLKSYNKGDTCEVIYEFDESIRGIFISSKNYIFTSCGGCLYRSKNAGQSFEKILTFSEEFTVLENRSITEDDKKRLFVGEYGNKRDTKQNKIVNAWIYWSNDDGDSWEKTDFLCKDGATHVHMLQFNPYEKKLYLAEGDSKKRLWVNESMECFSKFYKSNNNEKKGWRLLRKGMIDTGGYLCMTGFENSTYLGTDYAGGINFLVHFDDDYKFTKYSMTGKYRKNPIKKLAIMKGSSGNEIFGFSHNQLHSHKLGNGTFSFNESTGEAKLIVDQRYFYKKTMFVAPAKPFDVNCFLFIKFGEVTMRLDFIGSTDASDI